MCRHRRLGGHLTAPHEKCSRAGSTIFQRCKPNSSASDTSSPSLWNFSPPSGERPLSYSQRR
jgi:hypothetical protein